MTPDAARAWDVIAWWHRVRPERQIDFFAVSGPLGPAAVTATKRSTFVPEHVKEARRLLGFPPVHRAQGERP